MLLSEFFNIEIKQGKQLKLFDSNNNQVYSESSNHFWVKSGYDSNNNEVYCENSEASWAKREFDSNDNEIYFENSMGHILDNRPKPVVEMTMAQICEVLGKEVKIVE